MRLSWEKITDTATEVATDTEVATATETDTATDTGIFSQQTLII